MTALLTLLLMHWGVCAQASLSIADIPGLDALSEQSVALGGADVRAFLEKLLSGAISIEDLSVSDWIGRFLGKLRTGLTDVLSTLAAPTLVGLMLRALLGASEGGGAVTLLCRLGCAAVLMERFAHARQIADAALTASASMVDAAAPVLASALAIAGAPGSSAILTPSAALCAKLIADILRGVGLPLCGVAAAVAACADLSEQFQLNRLFALIRRGVGWGVRLLMAGFVGLLTIHGLLVGGQDAAVSQAVRRVIRSALPFVGGEISDSAGALMASALAVRRALGAAGLMAALSVCAVPLMRLALCVVSLKMAAAVLEPLCEPGLARVTGRFADVASMLLALCAGAATLGALCLGASLAWMG